MLCVSLCLKVAFIPSETPSERTKFLFVSDKNPISNSMALEYWVGLLKGFTQKKVIFKIDINTYPTHSNGGKY